MLLHSSIEIALLHVGSCRFAASLYDKKIIRNTQERLFANHVFRMIEHEKRFFIID